MTLYSSTTNRLPDAGTSAPASPALLSRSVRACISLWRKWRSIRATGLLLDCMDHSALEDLRMTRLGRGVRWLDCVEASLCGDFEYRLLRDDAGRRAAD